ncbi:MAG: hypothetical protein V4592_26525 [Bacteroidota bacterium]
MKKAFLLLIVVLAAGRVFAQSNPQTTEKPHISVVLKTDTVVYLIDHQTVYDGKIDQLLKTMPSFEFAADGSVTHQGQVVKKVAINGRSYMGLDITKIIKRLPVSILENMEVVDDYSHVNFANSMKHQDPDKLLNLNIKPSIMADVEYYLANRPSRPYVSRPGLYDDPALYGDINYINEHNPLDRQVNRAVRNMLAISDGMNEVDQYGDQIPHFLIPTPYPVRDVSLKLDSRAGRNRAPKALQLNP